MCSQNTLILLCILVYFISCGYGRISSQSTYYNFLLKCKTGYKYELHFVECEEYAKYVYEEEDSPVLMRRSAKHNVSHCAIAVTPLVIGGIAAIPREFPHMVNFLRMPTEAYAYIYLSMTYFRRGFTENI